MNKKPITLLELDSDHPIQMGHQHGECFRSEIAELAEIRMERMCKTSNFRTVRDVLALAEAHVPILERFDSDLFLELKAIADASNVSLQRLIVLNHFTDMRDIDPDGQCAWSSADNECSVLFSPQEHGPILGQTWDIHASAEPFVILIKTKDALIFSVTGCLGMTGINRFGTAVAINNLVSTDARVGLLWPALIRKALIHSSAEAAFQEIMDAPMASGRHFAIADETEFFSVEASGSKKKIITRDASKIYFHTNHCLDKEMVDLHIIREESTTMWRYNRLEEIVATHELSTAEQIFTALKEVSLAPKQIDHTATCGTFVMDIARRSVYACQGIARPEYLPTAKFTLG